MLDLSKVNYLKFLKIGDKVLCRVVRSLHTQAVLKVNEIDNTPAEIDYNVFLKGNSIGEENYICDTIKKEDIIECVVSSFSDNGIFVSKL